MTARLRLLFLCISDKTIAPVRSAWALTTRAGPYGCGADRYNVAPALRGDATANIRRLDFMRLEHRWIAVLLALGAACSSSSEETPAAATEGAEAPPPPPAPEAAP